MKPDDWLHKALAISPPWQITHLLADPAGRSLEVWVGLAPTRSGWFFSQRASPPPANLPMWRHLNLGQMACYIHANPHETGQFQEHPWRGEVGQPFTHALGQQIGAFLLAGLSIQSICPLLDLPAADLWKFKHSLDHGRAGLCTPAAGAEPGAIPDAHHPVWLELLTGQRQIEIRALSLKLLLTKLRDQAQRITDSEVRLLKANELQRYFVRHAHLLSHELAQLHLD